jgi:dimeric dUTPase (all-alpha-NTP-PPase superfamily)
MNLSKLFEIQRQLDERIMEEHPELKGQNNLDWKILALQVELGECANEWRGFKKWSHDQEPRTELWKDCEFCGGRGFVSPANYPYGHQRITCIKCRGERQFKTNPLLEEYVDCLHFILSIGLELEITDVEIDSDYTHEDPPATFVELFGDTWEMFNFRETHDKHNRFIQISIYERMFNRFVGIGEKHLGFTWEQIEQAYFEKNKVNHQRQQEGY